MNEQITLQLDSQLSLNLLENGIGFVLKGLDEIIGENHTLENAKSPESEICNYKNGITNLFSGFLLLLNDRLSRQVPKHIFMGRISDVKLKLKLGKRPPIVVDLDEALKLIQTGPKHIFTQEDIEVIRKIEGFRDRFEQNKVTENIYQLWAEITKFVDVIEKIIHDESGIELELNSKESKLLHKKANALRKIVVNFDRVIENEFFEVFHVMSGVEIPGRFLGAGGNIILPNITYSQKIYYMGCEKYIPDFEGNSSDGFHWVVEVKGAYIYKGGIPVLERLLSIQNQSPLNKTWFISLGMMSEGLRDFANHHHIYFTDITTWEELKRCLILKQFNISSS